MGFLAGLVFCITGLLFAMVSRLSRNSDPEVILVVCSLLGAGVLLVLAGISIAGIHQSLSRSYSFIAGIFLSAAALTVFVFSFPDNWLYPEVSYVIISYSLGIFLLLINIFVNYFLQSPHDIEQEKGKMQHEDSNYHQRLLQRNDCSVLTTFTGILMTNIIKGINGLDGSGSIEGTKRTTYTCTPSYLTRTADTDNDFIVANTVLEENDSGGLKMTTHDDTMDNRSLNRCNTETNETEPTALETTQFPEIVDVPEQDVVEGQIKEKDEKHSKLSETSDSDRKSSEKNASDVPYSEFRSIKKTNVKSDDTMREAARKILMYHFGQMVEHERGTKVGKDAEELHDMRVAAMRMRSVIEVLEEYLDMKEISSHYKRIKSIRKVLGSVRDLDVFLEKIEHFTDQAPEMAPEMEPLTDSILIERTKERGSMLVYLDDKKYNKFKNKFSNYLLNKKAWKTRTLKKNGDPVPCKVRDVLPVLLYTQFAAVRAYDEVVSEETKIEPSFDQYHQLRIDVKIFRYTIEFFKEVLGSESKDLIKDLKALQDNLGDMHDNVVALELLENFEKYGKWGETDGKDVPVSELSDYPGVDAYIEFKKQELERLVEAFPQTWARVIDPDFSVMLSKAIAGIYTS